MKYLYFVLSLLLFVCHSTFSTTLIYKTLNDLSTDANSIVIGEVTSVQSFWTPNHQYIRTTITLRVTGTLKGFAPQTLTFTQDGGTVGETSLFVEEMPEFVAGQRVILFLSADLKEMSPVCGMSQGRFNIVRDPSTGEDFITTNHGARVIGLSSIGDVVTDQPIINRSGRLLILGGTVSTKESEVEKIPIAKPISTASDFIEAIAARTHASANDIRIPETKVSIQQNKKSFQIFLQGGTPKPQYVINKYWNNATCTIMFSPSQYPDASVQYQRIKDAAFAWNNLAGSRFTFVENTNRTERSAPNADGTNYITRGPLSSGVLGVTYWWPGGNGPFSEIDLIMSTSVSWTYTNPSSCTTGSPYDFWNVAVHEFGHALGLGHEDDKPATLNSYYPGGWSGNFNHDVMADDRNAVRVNYSSSNVVPREFFTTRWKMTTPGSGVVSPVSNSPSSATIGSAITVEYSLHTQGFSTPCKPLRVGFYLSSDAAITPSDNLMGVTYFAPADTFTTGTFSSLVTVPNVTPGAYYIGWYIDDLNLYTETDETNNGSARCSQITINAGTAATKSISVSPSPVNFGPQPLNTSSVEKQVTITNSASSTRSISGYAYLDCSVTEFDITSGDGPFTLSPGQSKTLLVQFTPSQCGPRSAILHIDHDATNQSSPTNITLDGSGACADIIFAQTDVQFGKVDTGTTTTRDFVFQNASSSIQSISGTVALSQNAAGQYSIQSGGGSFSLAPGASRTVTIQYKSNACGDANGTLTITHNALNEPSPKNFPITGFGACRGITVFPASVNFGTLEIGQQSLYESIVISNSSSSNDTLTLNVLCPLTGGGANDFQINPTSCGQHILLPGESAELQALFKPQGEGLRLVQMIIQHNATTSAPKPLLVELRGAGITIPKIPTVSVATSLAFGPVLVGRDSTRILTVSNTGNATLSIRDILIEGGQNFDFTVTPVDSFQILQGQSANFTVKFRPGALGDRSSSLKFSSNDPNKPQVSVSLSGTGLAPKISVNVQQLDFGQVTLGSNVTQNFPINNDGNINLQVSAIAITGTNVSDFTFTSPPPYDIPAGQSQNVSVKFTPSSTGQKSAAATITSNGGNPITVNLSGEGIPQPVAKISLDQTSIDFGSVQINNTASRQLEITNTGTADLNIAAVTVTNFSPTDFSTNFTTPLTIQPGSKSNLTIEFKPKSVGQSTATLNIQSNDQQNPSSVVALRGNGTALPKPQIVLSSTDIDFGIVVLPQAKRKFLVIENQGNASLDITKVQFNSTGQSEFSFNLSQPLTIAAGRRDSIAVDFSPTSAGSKSAQMEITHNDPDKGILTVRLSGNAITGGKLIVNSQVLDFGTLDVNDPPGTRTLIVENVGSVQLAITKQQLSGPNASDFTVIKSLPSTLASGASDSAKFTLTPKAGSLGNKSATFTIETDATASVQVDISLIGSVIDITDVPSTQPKLFALHQNYPNPFSGGSPSTQIRYDVERRGLVEIKVHNILGNLIATPVSAFLEAGTYSIQFDAANLPDGIYFYRMTADKFFAVRKMTILK